MFRGSLATIFGWTFFVEGQHANPRASRNFPIQACGAELMRLACCFAVERGVKLCGVVHDALLVEAPLSDIEGAIEQTQRAMSDASAAVLEGFRLRSDVEVICHPERYSDPRGARMWDIVTTLLQELEKPEEGVRACNTDIAPAHTCSISSHVLNGIRP